MLELSGTLGGMCCYLAVSGGFDIPLVMGSRSTCIKAGIGGVQGRYFIPLMFPLYMVLSGPLETRPALWYYLLELAELVMLGLTVWTTVISRFCL